MRKAPILLFSLCVMSTAIIAQTVKCWFTLAEPAAIGSIELKSGQYDVRVSGANAAISDKSGKAQSIPVKIETLPTKWDGNTYLDRITKDGKSTIVAITVGHSKTKLVFGQ